ncbi:uncharacterized protein L201_005978 [Kwoniella dendrophila CBS 6074]|uniref:Monopolin complex subunit Csm1/Pcs1 C-terminal domain-containing protein n=1 Tax=Kwoniella dendrophila CBS 6074 TaxID=1295534 RepID=A0AAX4K1T5_9TREE
MSSASAAKSSKKIGKETASSSRSTKKVDGEDQIEENDEGEDIPRKSSKPMSKTASSSKSTQHTFDDEDDPKELKRKLATISAERDRYRSQRDTYSTQFEELTKTRSDGDDLLEKYKQKFEIQVKAQNDIIASQTALTEKLQAKVKSLEKALSSQDKEKEVPNAGGPFEDSSSNHIINKSNSQEVRNLKDELNKIKNDNKAKDNEILELQKQYKVEVEYSKSLIEKQQSLNSSTLGNKNALNSSTSNKPSSNISLTPEEAEKDASSLALYEDLTLLNITNVKIKPARIGKEEIFNCLLCVDGKTLSFKLRCYIELDKSSSSSNSTGKPKYNKSVHYTPDLTHNESEEFITKLDYFSSEFVVSRDQLGGFLLELRSKLSDDEEQL